MTVLEKCKMATSCCYFNILKSEETFYDSSVGREGCQQVLDEWHACKTYRIPAVVVASHAEIHLVGHLEGN